MCNPNTAGTPSKLRGCNALLPQASAMEVVYTGECLCAASDCSACEPPPPLAGGGAMEFAAGRPVVAADGSQLAAAYGGVGRFPFMSFLFLLLNVSAA